MLNYYKLNISIIDKILSIKRMKCLVVLTLLLLVNFNLCAIDRQVAVAASINLAYAPYTIAQTDAAGLESEQFYDNVITYEMKYFLDGSNDSVTYSDHTGAINAVLNQASFLYSFNRAAVSGTTYSSTGPFTDQNLNAGVVGVTNRLVKHYPILFKDKPVDYPYIAFEITPDCTTIDAADSPPFIVFKAKFFCSDEEAKAEYDKIIATVTSKASLAWVSMSGVCTSPLDTYDYAGNMLQAAVTVCQLLTGYDTNTNAYCKP